jgi:FAD/FMN-containing dehydrogenase
MADVQVTTLSGVDTVLKEADVAAFKKSLRGQLIAPSDDSYTEARQVWNGNITATWPVRPVADVIQVNFARDHNCWWPRGGAHNIAGTCVCNGGLVIDLSLMKAIRVDPVRRTVRAEGGVKWGAFDRETQAFGLATTGGTIADTGIAGLTLGGGHGWLGYKYGLASDNLTSVDIVTADGEVRIANACSHPDLFWALKGGGGGSLGVVTRLTLRVHPLPEDFGAVNMTIKAASPAAFRKLVGLIVEFCAQYLIDPHWGEQIRFLPDDVCGSRWCSRPDARPGASGVAAVHGRGRRRR